MVSGFFLHFGPSLIVFLIVYQLSFQLIPTIARKGAKQNRTGSNLLPWILVLLILLSRFILLTLVLGWYHIIRSSSCSTILLIISCPVENHSKPFSSSRILFIPITKFRKKWTLLSLQKEQNKSEMKEKKKKNEVAKHDTKMEKVGKRNLTEAIIEEYCSFEEMGNSKSSSADEGEEE